MAAVRLQTDDVDRLNAAQRILLSPLDHEDPAEWQLCANRAVRRLVGADHSVFSLPSDTRPVLVTDDTDPSFPERFLGYFAGVVAGEYRFRDPMLENAERIRRAVGPAAFHERDLASRDAIRRSVALQEIFRPAGLTSQIGISVSLPVAEATQFFGFEGTDAERRSERGLELLQLLVPTFEAGVRMLVAVERRRPPLPAHEELTDRFALTAREAEVALLLARGLTDVAIAERLAISPHTARRYSERVLRKLDLHSRAAVAITLLGLTDERPDPMGSARDSA